MRTKQDFQEQLFTTALRFFEDSDQHLGEDISELIISSADEIYDAVVKSVFESKCSTNHVVWNGPTHKITDCIMQDHQIYQIRTKTGQHITTIKGSSLTYLELFQRIKDYLDDNVGFRMQPCKIDVHEIEYKDGIFSVYVTRTDQFSTTEQT